MEKEYRFCKPGSKYGVLKDRDGYFQPGDTVIVLEDDSLPFCVSESDFVKDDFNINHYPTARIMDLDDELAPFKCSTINIEEDEIRSEMCKFTKFSSSEYFCTHNGKRFLFPIYMAEQFNYCPFCKKEILFVIKDDCDNDCLNCKEIFTCHSSPLERR